MPAQTAPLNWNFPDFFSPRFFDELDGTNAEAKRQAALGAAAGSMFIADIQTGGRGRGGRHWVSPKGNLYCSILLRPEGPHGTVAQAALTSFVAALAIADTACWALQALPESKIGLKWPNDVLLNERKMSGILLESAAGGRGCLEWLVVGMGINLANHPEGTDTPATSLSAEGAGEITPLAFLEHLAPRFLYWYEILQRDGFVPLRQAWLQRALMRGEKIRVRLPNDTLYGIFHDLNLDGALILRTDDGDRYITSGDVFFPDTTK